MRPHKPKAAVITLGCRLNHAESALLHARLHEAGYTVVPYGESADLGIINTCTVTGEADAKCRKIIRGFIRHNPGAFVAVIGCMPQVSAKRIAGIEGVDLVVGTARKLDVLDYVRAEKNQAPVVVCNGVPDDDFKIDCPATGVPRAETRANLKIQEGCDNMCAYCIVPLARGKPRSREMPNLIDEARALTKAGVKEIVLTGVNVGAYAWRGNGIVDVIDALNDIEGLPRVRVSSIELSTIPEGLLQRMNDPDHALVPFLHVPLQSGCDKTLEAMGRPYKAAVFKAFLEKAHAEVDTLCIGADVMVGFPGETEQDFEQSCTFLAESPIDYAHVFKFSPRPNTRAVKMAGRVSPPVVNGRSGRMREISAGKRAVFHLRNQAKTYEVLFEQKTGGRWTGYTPNYIRAAVESSKDLENRILAVTLLESRGETMTGVLAE